MSLELLDKTRKINKLLTEQESDKIDFRQFCNVLSNELNVNVLLTSKKGKVLGLKECQGIEEFPKIKDIGYGDYIDSAIRDRFMNILSTKENVNLETLGFETNINNYSAVIVPIDIAEKRFGTLFIYRNQNPYDIDDIILCEYGSTVVGLEMMRSVFEENEDEERNIQNVKSAINTLSFSELEAIIHIFDELQGEEGILVASRIADRVGITRSVIVNALRKFESAGVIESRSSGMKGTYIKVLNDVIFDELEELKARKNLKATEKDD